MRKTIWIILGIILLIIVTFGIIWLVGLYKTQQPYDDVACETTQECMDRHNSCLAVCSLGKCYFTGALVPHQLPLKYPECEFKCESPYHIEKDYTTGEQRCVMLP